MPQPQNPEYIAKKQYVDNSLNNVVRNIQGTVSISDASLELSQKTVEDPETHEEEVVPESYLYKTRLHLENSTTGNVAEYNADGIILNNKNITGITDVDGNSSTLAASQKAVHDAVSGLSPVTPNPQETATNTLTKIQIGNTVYEVDGGSDVAITPSLVSGTKIADFEIDGVSGSLYAPQGTQDTEEPISLFEWGKFDGTAYFTTPFKVNENYEITVIFDSDEYVHDTSVIGTNESSSSKYFSYPQLTMYSNKWYIGRGGNAGETYFTYSGGKHTFICNYFTEELSNPQNVYDGSFITGYTPVSDDNASLLIGFRTGTSTNYHGKICEFKIRDRVQDALLYDIVPAVKNNTIGFYDKVSKTFTVFAGMAPGGDQTDIGVYHIIAKEYYAGNTYEEGEYCIYNNDFYKCNTSISTPEAFNPSKWTKTLVSDEFGSGGGGGGGDEILHPIIAGSANNTDSSGSNYIEYTYPGSETITINNFFKNLKSYTFTGYNYWLSTTTLTSYENNRVNYSWTGQSGSTQQWFDIVLVEDLSLLHELSPWTKYYGGSYTFEVPNGIDEDSIIIDFRSIKSGNSMDITNANVTKSISNNILTVTLPMHEGNTYTYIEAKIYYLKKPTKYSKVIGNPLETPTEVLNSIKIINDDIVVNNYLVNGQIATSNQVYISCNLDTPLTNGDYNITIKDTTKGYEYYKTFTYAGQDVVLNWNENGLTYSLKITETTAGLTEYSSNWRNMYCDIYRQYLDNKVYEIKGGDNSVELTMAEYNALPTSEKMNGTTYLITDANNVIGDRGNFVFTELYKASSSSVVTTSITLSDSINNYDFIYFDFIADVPNLGDFKNSHIYPSNNLVGINVGATDDIVYLWYEVTDDTTLTFFSQHQNSNYHLDGVYGINLNIENNNKGGQVDYSTTEQDTGIKWLDGSPIYQKTIALNNTAYNGGLSGIPHNITNLGQVISFNVNFLDTNPPSDREWTRGVIQPPMQLRADATSLYFYSTYAGDTYSWDAKTSRTWYITLQYTKSS